MAEQAQPVASVTEPQSRLAPALSATSDAPKVETTPDAKPEANAEGDTGVAPKTEGDKPEGEGDQDTGAEPGEGEGESAKTAKPKDELPPYAKREITKARNQKREADAAKTAAEARANTAESNLKKALEAVEKLTGESANVARKTADADDPRPKRDAFDNPDAYDTALVDWAGRRAAQAATAALEAKSEADRTKVSKETEERETAQRNKETVEAFAKRKDAFIEDHPDYADVAEADDLQISIPMAQAIMQDEDGPAIAYYLGQNPDEAIRISKLTPVRAVAELGRIAARLNAKPVVSTKPKPITPLKTGASPATRKTANDESMDEYAARRNAEMRGKSNGAAVTH